jgi:hypothetical protein
MARSPQGSRRGFCQFEKVSVDKAGWISKELNLNMTYQGNNFLGLAGLGVAGQDKTRTNFRGGAGQGAARRGNARQGEEQFSWRGGAWQGAARRGNARQGLISPGEREPTQSNTNKIT